jgi:hypothetical protein
MFIHKVSIAMKFNYLPKLMTIATIAGTASISIASQAEAITLNFEGLQDNERIENFYNGGTGSQNSTGTNFGVVFTSGATGQIQGVGGPQSFTNPPSPSTVMFTTGNNNYLNVADGFISTFSLAYGNSSNQTATIRIFDGLNGTGNELTFGTLLQNNPSNTISTFNLLNLGFVGTARSVLFDVTANNVAFDDINLTLANTPTAVPEPLTIFGTIIGGTAAFRIKKKLKATSKV